MDEAALAAAIRDGQIGDATLDVFRTEPLPADHPFWGIEEISITPHLASIAIPSSAAAQIAENIRRLRAGQPLLNVVDRGGAIEARGAAVSGAASSAHRRQSAIPSRNTRARRC